MGTSAPACSLSPITRAEGCAPARSESSAPRTPITEAVSTAQWVAPMRSPTRLLAGAEVRCKRTIEPNAFAMNRRFAARENLSRLAEHRANEGRHVEEHHEAVGRGRHTPPRDADHVGPRGIGELVGRLHARVGDEHDARDLVDPQREALALMVDRERAGASVVAFDGSVHERPRIEERHHRAVDEHHPPHPDARAGNLCHGRELHDLSDLGHGRRAPLSPDSHHDEALALVGLRRAVLSQGGLRSREVLPPLERGSAEGLVEEGHDVEHEARALLSEVGRAQASARAGGSARGASRRRRGGQRGCRPRARRGAPQTR